MIKLIPPYWDNKATPTPYFIFNFLIISLILLKINGFTMRLSDLKMEGKSLGKGGIELGSIFSTETDVKERVC